LAPIGAAYWKWHHGVIHPVSLPSEPFPQTQPNFTSATETIYLALNNQRFRLYDAPNLRQHVLNAASWKQATAFGSPRKSSVQRLTARSRCRLRAFAAGQVAGPLSPEELKRPIKVETEFNPLAGVQDYRSNGVKVETDFQP